MVLHLAIEYATPAWRDRIATEYDTLLVPFAVGNYGIAEPKPHETRLAVRRRLSAAAKQRGWHLTFVPSEGEHLIFQVRADAGA